MRENQINIAILGDAAVGKTQLISKLSEKSWDDILNSNSISSHKFNCNLKGIETNVNISEVVGHIEDYNLTFDFSSVDLFVICYSVISPTSFVHIQNKWLELVKHQNEKAKVMLMATKSDLRNDNELLERLAQRNETPLPEKVGKQYAKSIGASFFESSISITREDLLEFIQAAYSDKKSKKKNGKCSIC